MDSEAIGNHFDYHTQNSLLYGLALRLTTGLLVAYYLLNRLHKWESNFVVIFVVGNLRCTYAAEIVVIDRRPPL